MWLDEHDAKQLLAQFGVPSPPGDVARDPAEAASIARAIGGPAYVKALVAGKDRAARGGVKRVDDPQDAGRAFLEVTSALAATEARVEAACEVRQEWFLGVGILPGDPGPSVIFSAEGGSGIEQRAPAFSKVAVDIALGLQPFHSRRLAGLAALPSEQRAALQQMVASCYELLIASDATLVEINPLAVTPAGIVAIDAHVTIDDYAMFRQVALGASRSASREAGGISAELRRDGIEYIPIGGNIGIVGLGAGLTMHLADWIVDCGGSPAFFFDATAAAVRDWAAMFSGQTPRNFAAVLKNGLARVRGDIAVLLVNFTSGGTPVDALVKAMLLAVRELHWEIPLVVHVAGNSQVAAAQLLRSSGVEPFPRLGDAVRAAVQASGGAAA